MVDKLDLYMPENIIRWVVEDQLILVKVYEWDMESLKHDTLAVNDMINQSDRTLVHSIWDLRDMEKYPTNLREILKTNQILLSNERLGWSIAIINNKFIGFFAQALGSMYRIRQRIFTSMEETTTFLHERDSTLPELTDLLVK